MKLFGKNPVIERLKVNPKSVRKVSLQQGHPDIAYVRKKTKKWGIPVFVIPRAKMLKIGRNTNSQGIMADVEDFEYADYQEMLIRAKEKKITLLFLDGLTDPQNLGVIIRSLACLGEFAIVLPKKDSVGVTESVFRVASGGDIYVSIARVANLNKAIHAAKELGFFIAGAVAEGGENLTEISFSFPVGLVIGSEQKGIRDVVLKNLDIGVTIPMKQPRLSFNAAQATTILCYEITKQKKKK